MRDEPMASDAVSFILDLLEKKPNKAASEASSVVIADVHALTPLQVRPGLLKALIHRRDALAEHDDRIVELERQLKIYRNHAPCEHAMDGEDGWLYCDFAECLFVATLCDEDEHWCPLHASEERRAQADLECRGK